MARKISPYVVPVLLGFILCLAVLLRFYRLEDNPPGFYFDEAFFANVGFSLVSTGRDLNGVFLPLVSYGHGTVVLPLQMYPVAASIYVFGFNAFAVRFVTALFGVLMVLASFLLARLLFGDAVGLTAALLVAVSPFHVVYSRIGFANLLFMPFFFVFGLYLLIKGVTSDLTSSRFLAVIGALSLGMTFFSYSLAFSLIPLFMYGFHSLFYGEIVRNGKRSIYSISLFLVALLAASSFLFTHPSNTASGVPASSVQEFLSNVFELLSISLSSSGLWSWPPYANQFGIIYPVCIPFLLLGVILLLRRMDSKGYLVVYWLLVALVIGPLLSNAFSGSIRRSFTCAGPVVELIIAYAVYRILLFYHAHARIFWLFGSLFAVGLSAGFAQFFIHYFLYQPTSAEAERVFMVPASALFNYTESIGNRYDWIVVTSDFETTPYNTHLALGDYVLFYTGRRLNESKYVFGNLSAYGVAGTPSGRLLIVARDYEMVNATPDKVFYFSNGDVAYKIIA